MAAFKTISYILAAILILFGVLFIVAAFGETTNLNWAIIGGILLVIGFAIILVASIFFKSTTSETSQLNTTLQVDLPADVDVERFKCQDCGAQLTMDNVKIVAGAPMVDCPYCGAAYQLTEKPKW